jgi:hypothetical protein
MDAFERDLRAMWKLILYTMISMAVIIIVLIVLVVILAVK